MLLYFYTFNVKLDQNMTYFFYYTKKHHFFKYFLIKIFFDTVCYNNFNEEKRPS
jgi:hypothetical protein